ncbi:hypothetical protein [Streptomyces sp. NBC_00306]|uniref:hypothetical protein n=1 Tax=Streptomyces sp. NBC_00306 TaxID=2975708 RepID=UPI002E2E6FAD|nr:hypothetical protein [Streptomyces sp. NBC_00306]
MPLATPKTWVVGEVVDAAELNAEIKAQFQSLIDDYQLIPKTANETITSSATLQNDNHLLGSMAANAVYLVTVRLAVNGASGGDFKMAWSMPTGTTASQRFCFGPDVSSAASTAGTTVRASGITNGHLVEINYGLFTTGTQSYIEETLRVETASTAGTCQLRWAQNAISATGTTVEAGSWLEIKRVA